MTIKFLLFNAVRLCQWNREIPIEKNPKSYTTVLLLADKEVGAACTGLDTECVLNAECTASTCSCKSGYTAANSNTQCNGMYVERVCEHSVSVSTQCICVKYVCMNSLYASSVCVHIVGLSVCSLSLCLNVCVC